MVKRVYPGIAIESNKGPPDWMLPVNCSHGVMARLDPRIEELAIDVKVSASPFSIAGQS